MISKIENGSELFVEGITNVMKSEIHEHEADYDIEMMDKKGNTADARQKRNN